MFKFIIGTVALATLVGTLSRMDPRDHDSASPAVAVAPALPTPAAPYAGNGFADATLARAPDGHFYAELLVNGTPVKFLVDTGASSVALTRADAQRIGLQFSDSEFTGYAETANGRVALKPVTLDRITLGPLEATQVQGAIIDKGLTISLLGQSWLKRVGVVTIEGDKMVLR